jgi:TolB-like protein/cytochrome c-type biogenesis protein CcmH/NrfG
LSHLKNLIHEIHRRSVWQVVGIYLLGGWIALQVVDTLVDSLGLPDWFPAFAVMLLIVGFPIVVATAFVQEGVGGSAATGTGSAGAEAASGGSGAEGALTEDVSAETSSPIANLAHGTGSLDRPSSRPPRLYRLLTWKNAIGGGVLAFALWGVFAAGWLLAGGGPIGGAPGARVAPAEDDLRSIAVLPFDNLTTDEENAFFADGVHEDVLTQLSKIADLTVISRTSVLVYRDDPKPLGEIGAELGVRTILEGSVRRSGDNVRVTAQLIDTETDAHLWAENFDRALTAANVFAIQTEIAQRIADALQATLSPEEASRIARLPTDDLDAYDATLRARQAYNRYTAEDNDEAIRLFRRAAARDPAYAEPWAGLADAYGQRALRYGYGPEWADSSEAAARHALSLTPDLATAYKALGLAHIVRQEVDEALAANLRAIELDPNYGDAINNAGATYLRMGRLADALRWYKRSFRLQPNNEFARSNVASAYIFLGENAIGLRWIEDALAVDPTKVNDRCWQALFYTIDGQYARGVELIEVLEAERPDDIYVILFSSLIHARAGNHERAAEAVLHSLELSPDQGLLGWQHVALPGGFALEQLGRDDEATELLTGLLERSAAEVETEPRNPNTHAHLAFALAALGRYDEAIDALERAYETGFRYRITLDLYPVWDDVRDDPRFQALYQAIADDVERMRLEIEREEIEAGER